MLLLLLLALGATVVIPANTGNQAHTIITSSVLTPWTRSRAATPSWHVASVNSNLSEASSSSATDDNQTSSDRVLYYTGKSYTTGEVHKGGTTLDWKEQKDDVLLAGPPDQHH